MSVNNEGTKLASGGLDGKVKIWDMQSILNYKVPESNHKHAVADTFSLRMEEPSTEPLQRPLASMSRHNGVVTCVKFSPDGRFLASGSDDKIVLIWEKDEEQSRRPKQFGETEADLEHWTVRKRLVAHDNDVQDICWSPDGSLLITVGLDRSIIIWSGVTFERIKRYDIHQSMVKGIVFDPANKFFATASDDRSVRIFRYYRKINDSSSGGYEFQMEQIIMDPFKKSPLTSYFRRMSWSPDGQHIAVPNATNGPVTSVVIINRGNWATDVSLIGHEAPCEVCSFSPRLFRLGNSIQSQKFTTILASGGQDRTLAIWSTATTKPLVVAEDIVESSITDICWTPSGEALFLSSLDGSITCVTFEAKELGDVVSEDVNDSQLLRYGGDRDSAIFAESTDQLKLESLAMKTVSQTPPIVTVTMQEEPAPRAVTPQPPTTPATLTINNLTPKQVNKLTQSVKITKDGKKRVTPILVSTYSGSTKSTLMPSVAKVSKPFDISSKVSQTSYFLPRLGIQTGVHGLRLRVLRAGLENELKVDDPDNNNEDMGLEGPTNSQLQTLSGSSLRKRLRKYRKMLMVQKYPTPFKMISSLPEVLFSNQAVMNYELAKLIQNKDIMPLSNNDMLNTTALESIDENLVFQVIVSTIQHLKSTTIEEDSNLDTSNLVTSTVEVRNGPSWPDDDETLSMDFSQRLDFQDPTQVIVTNSERESKRAYILYFPYKIQQVLPIIFEEKLFYYVLISFDGTIQIVHAESGNYVLPGIELGSNVVFSKQKGRFLLLLTSQGLIYSWNLHLLANEIRGIKAVLSGVSIAPILNCETTFEIPKPLTEKEKKTAPVPSVIVENVRAIEIDENAGIPYVILERSNNVYTYSAALKAWTNAIDSWYYLSVSKGEVESLVASELTTDLVKRTYHTTQENIRKGQKGQYIFDEGNSELKLVMQARFRELLEIA